MIQPKSGSPIVQPLIDALIPKGQSSSLPMVTPCPYCGSSMSQAAHALHRDACKQAFKDAPPQAPDFMHDAGGGYNADKSFIQT